MYREVFLDDASTFHLSSQWRNVIGFAIHDQSASEFTLFSSRSSATGMGAVHVTVHVTGSKLELNIARKLAIIDYGLSPP